MQKGVVSSIAAVLVPVSVVAAGVQLHDKANEIRTAYDSGVSGKYSNNAIATCYYSDGGIQRFNMSVLPSSVRGAVEIAAVLGFCSTSTHNAEHNPSRNLVSKQGVQPPMP